MGVPGAGKGTQAVLLTRALGVPRICTGDILREAVQNGSPLGRRVRDHLRAGTLVPDETISDLVAERLARPDARGGFVLDGFPRTLDQVARLDRVLEGLGAGLDSVFMLTAPEREIVSRLTGRRICPGCGEVYHVNNRPPRSAGVCDGCGCALVQRQDDTEEVILERMDVFRTRTMPIAWAYAERGLLHEVDGAGEPTQVLVRLRAGLESA